MGAAADLTIWQWVLYSMNGAVALVMTCAFAVAVGGLQYLFFKSLSRRLTIGGAERRWGEKQAIKMEATFSVLIDAQTSTARKRIWTAWKVFFACFLYFVAATFVSALSKS